MITIIGFSRKSLASLKIKLFLRWFILSIISLLFFVLFILFNFSYSRTFKPNCRYSKDKGSSWTCKYNICLYYVLESQYLKYQEGGGALKVNDLPDVRPLRVCFLQFTKCTVRVRFHLHAYMISILLALWINMDWCIR